MKYGKAFWFEETTGTSKADFGKQWEACTKAYAEGPVKDTGDIDTVYLLDAGGTKVLFGVSHAYAEIPDVDTGDAESPATMPVYDYDDLKTFIGRALAEFKLSYDFTILQVVISDLPDPYFDKEKHIKEEALDFLYADSYKQDVVREFLEIPSGNPELGVDTINKWYVGDYDSEAKYAEKNCDISAVPEPFDRMLDWQAVYDYFCNDEVQHTDSDGQESYFIIP